ncbi:MAG: hypothetical protein U0003_03215 [Vampirovibrionales bacterium]
MVPRIRAVKHFMTAPLQPLKVSVPMLPYYAQRCHSHGVHGPHECVQDLFGTAVRHERHRRLQHKRHLLWGAALGAAALWWFALAVTRDLNEVPAVVTKPLVAEWQSLRSSAWFRQGLRDLQRGMNRLLGANNTARQFKPRQVGIPPRPPW